MTSHAPPILKTGAFRKSSFSTDYGNANCVYVASLRDAPTVELRDSKRGLDIPGLTVGSAAFRAFIGTIGA